MATKPAMRPSDTPVESVLEALPEAKRAEAEQLRQLMSELTDEPARLWASRIVGFGQYRYRYESGREGEAPLAAFATNQRQHTVYLVEDFAERHRAQVDRLGTFTHSKACLYLKRLSDVDLDVLRVLVERSVRVSRAADVSGGAGRSG